MNGEEWVSKGLHTDVLRKQQVPVDRQGLRDLQKLSWRYVGPLRVFSGMPMALGAILNTE